MNRDADEAKQIFDAAFALPLVTEGRGLLSDAHIDNNKFQNTVIHSLIAFVFWISISKDLTVDC